MKYIALCLVMILVLIFLHWTNEIVIEKAHGTEILYGQTITAYSPSVDETDDDPTTGAYGKVYEGTIANNCYPKNTEVELNGQKFRVMDRMNRRYDCSHWDVFIDSKVEAKVFGRWINQQIIIK